LLPESVAEKATPEEPAALLTVMYCGETEAPTEFAVKLTEGEVVAAPPFTETLIAPPLPEPPTFIVTGTVCVPEDVSVIWPLQV
jgi:hypothetical protein